MSTTTTPPTHTTTYLEDALESLVQHNVAGTSDRQTAEDCLSCLTMVGPEAGEKNRRQQARARLIPSGYNIVGATKEDDLNYYESKCTFRALAASFLCSTMSQADQDKLKNDHGIDWQTALRLDGPLLADGTSPLGGSTFATEVSKNLNDVIVLDEAGALEDKKTVGLAGLRDRLGLVPTWAEKESRKTRRSLGLSVSDLEQLLAWTAATNANLRKDAKDLRSILGVPDAPSLGTMATRTAKLRLWAGDLNDKSLKSRKPQHPDSIWVFRHMAGKLIGQALMSCEGQEATMASLRSGMSDFSKAIPIECRFTTEQQPDSSSSRWICPANPGTSSAVDFMDQSFHLLTVEDGKIKACREMTAGEVVGTLAGMEENAEDQSAQGSKRKSAVAGSSEAGSSGKRARA